MEFKRNDKVISINGFEFTVLEDTDANSPYVKLIAMVQGKYLKTITTKNKLTKKD